MNTSISFRNLCLAFIGSLLGMHPMYSFAGNEPLTRTTRASGTWSISQNQDSNLEITGVTVSYSKTSTVSNTISFHVKTSPANNGNHQAITNELTSSVTEEKGTVTSTNTTKGWVDGNTSSPQTTSQNSSEYFAAYQPTGGWTFKSWIVGPPPTDQSNGAPTRVVNQISAEKKIITTLTRSTWALRWTETKSN